VVVYRVGRGVDFWIIMDELNGVKGAYYHHMHLILESERATQSKMMGRTDLKRSFMCQIAAMRWKENTTATATRTMDFFL
jgi:hypothetical protein